MLPEIAAVCQRCLGQIPNDRYPNRNELPTSPLSGEPLLKSRRIVEFKFREVLPVSFRGLIQNLRLEPAAFSKYRECVAACVSLNRLTGDAH